MSSLNYQSSALGMVVYSEFSDCINNCIKIPVQIHKSTLFFDAIFLFSRIILIYYPYGIMEAVSRDSNIGTFRIIFLLYSRSSVDSGPSLEKEHLGAFIIASKLTNVSNVLKFTKAMLWYYCFENKTDDSQPIRSLSLPGGKTI